jgi:3-hydroxymyristoyl/3-hydroxydecanoyl-(acyl carrier protein) dehydratases
MIQCSDFSLDMIEQITPGKFIMGYKRISNNENYFVGHPGSVPGTFQFNLMKQFLHILLHDKINGQNDNIQLIHNTMRLYREVIPGDYLQVSLEVVSSHGDIYTVLGRGYVEGNMVCQSDFTVKIFLCGDEND